VSACSQARPERLAPWETSSAATLPRRATKRPRRS
jgi:hypothetical protein